MSFEIDRSNWSPSSQRSGGHYDDKARFYENISCRCEKCETSFIFSAEEQKIAYEVRKEFTWRLPSLCQPCQKIRDALNLELTEFHQQWNTRKEFLKTDRNFLERWRYLLKEIQSYGRKGSSPSHITMINKLLNELA